MVRNKIRLTKSQLEDLKHLLSIYGDTKSTVDGFIRLISNGGKYEKINDLNYFNHSTIQRALVVGYEIIGDWSLECLGVLKEDVLNDLSFYCGDINELTEYRFRKEIYLELKNRRDVNIPFTIAKSFNYIDIEILGDVFGLNYTERIDFLDALNEGVNFKFFENENSDEVGDVKHKKHEPKRDYVKDALYMDIDYLLCQLKESLDMNEKELRERTLIALEEAAKNIKKEGILK